MGKRTNTATWVESRNRWQINVQKDGVRKTFTSSKPGRTGQREANAKADAWLDEGVDSKGLRVQQLLDDYSAHVKATTSYANWRGIETILRIRLSPAIGHMKISALTEGHLQKILDDSLNNNTQFPDRPLSKKSMLTIRATIVSFIKYCRVQRKATTLFPESLKISNAAKPVGKKILNPQDLRVLFSVDTAIYSGKRQFEPYIYAFRFAVLTGLRPGELIGLKWEDIVGDIVTVQRSINIHGQVTTGKNENARRGFVLTDTAEEVLRAQRQISETEYVFDILSEDNLRKHLVRYCESNGIPPVSPYELRHTFVSAMKALPEGQLKQLVGHSRSMDTFGVYGHELDGDKRAIAQKSQQIFDVILAQNKDETTKKAEENLA